MSPSHPDGPRPAARLTGLSLSLTRGCVVGPSRAGDSTPASPGAPAGRWSQHPGRIVMPTLTRSRGAENWGPDTALDVPESEETASHFPLGPGSLEMRGPGEVRAPEGDSGPAWDICSGHIMPN